MTIFEAVKTTVAPRMAAEHFGLSVSRNGMVCCPFHDDRHPSMKLYEDHYHCFGCQANGDVIAFTSKLFGITPLEAAQKLAADFGIREDRPSVLAKLKMYTTQAENEKLCFRVLSEYLHILQDWKKRYAPQAPEEEPDDRFVEACHMLECTQYMLDLLTIGSHEEKAELVKDMMKDNKITLLQERLQEIKKAEIKAYFTVALDFIQKHQSKDTIISAVVHMDEKTPHMHLCFVPLTKDKRLSAKEIVGNKKKLTWWQDEFWKHMVKKYPDLERGESASETGRTHIPPRLFKEAVHLNRMKEQIMAILNDSNPFNKKSKAEELETLLDKYVPGVEAMRTKLKKYDKTYKELTAENAELEKELNSASRESIQKKLEIQRKLSELDELRRTVDSIPDAVIREYTEQKYVHHGRMNQEI